MKRFALLLALALGGPAHAEGEPAAGRQTVPLTSDNDPAFLIGKGLRCPVCQGMPIAESPSEMAQAMMVRVREMLAEGKSPDEVRQYFVERYGEWVLLEPTREGVNVLVWVLPPIALVVGLGLALVAVRRLRGASTPTSTSTSTTTTMSTGPGAEDPYLAAVRRAVEEGEG